MTLPTDIILPLRPEQIKAGGDQLELYMRDLVTSLTTMYQDIVQNADGNLRPWTPTVYGLTTAGVGTYTYQNGWQLRAGLMTDLWFDIAWTAHTGTGNLAVLLPYKAAKSSNQPWVGVIESKSASNAFGAGKTYLVWQAEQDTTQGTVIACGTGVVSAQIALNAAGSFSGHIRYVGQEYENQ